MNVSSLYSRYTSSYASSLNSLYGSGKTNGKSIYSALYGNSVLGSSATGYVNKSALSYLSEMKTGSSDLKNALKRISSQSFFNTKTAISSNSEHLAIVSSNAKPSAPSISVTIDQIATGQINKGTALNSGSQNSDGYYKFEIEGGGSTQAFSVSVAAGEKNLDVQQKMADAINAKGTLYKAAVTFDTKSNTSSLTIESVNTGNDTKNNFSIRDVSGNLVARMGIDKVSQEAQDAVYRIDGGAARSSKTNTVDIGSGIKAELKKASPESVAVSMKTDIDASVSSVSEFVKNFNSLLAAAEKNSGDDGAVKLAKQLSTVSKTYASSLSRIGISVNSYGYMSADSGRMAKAAEDGSLGTFFSQNGSRNYGFSNQLTKVTDKITANPLAYLNNTGAGPVGETSLSLYNSILSNSKLSNMGLLMDFLI